MQVITSIYLNCRPDLRDEWLTGNEVDDLGEGQVNIYFTETRDPSLNDELHFRHRNRRCVNSLSFVALIHVLVRL
jgi:hypothetical protein